jgi:hypothetical protein
MPSEYALLFTSTALEIIVVLLVGFEVVMGEIRHRRSGDAMKGPETGVLLRRRIGVRLGLFIIVISGVLWTVVYLTYLSGTAPAVSVPRNAVPVVIAVLCAAVAGAILFVASWGGAAPSAAISPSSEDKKFTALRAQSLPYLKNGNIYAAALSANKAQPTFRAAFARQGKRGRLFVDDCVFFAGTLGPTSWSKRPRIFLQEFPDFVTEQGISVPLLTRADKNAMWQWGPSAAESYIWNAWHRGRLVFICDDGPPEYFHFFIIDPIISATDMPVIIGQERFDFAERWDESDGQSSF